MTYLYFFRKSFKYIAHNEDRGMIPLLLSLIAAFTYLPLIAFNILGIFLLVFAMVTALVVMASLIPSIKAFKDRKED